jgi:hypothetical protein
VSTHKGAGEAGGGGSGGEKHAAERGGEDGEVSCGSIRSSEGDKAGGVVSCGAEGGRPRIHLIYFTDIIFYIVNNFLNISIFTVFIEAHFYTFYIIKL